MGTSSITITALTATPTLRGNKLKATVLATGPAANLPNLTLKTVVFYASTTNDYTTAAEIARGNPEALDASLIEELTYYYWAFAVDNSDNVGAVFPVSPTGGVAATAIGMSGLAFGLANGKLVASVAGNALTVAIKTSAGADASAADSVFVAFPNSTLTIGNYQPRQIAAALSLIISNGSTLGVSTTLIPFRLWVVLFDDAGTLRLGVINCSIDPGVIKPLSEYAVASSIAEGGAGAADSIGIFYTGVAVAAKAFRIIGYLDWNSGLVTPGAWAASPDVVRITGANVPTPGRDLQENAGINQSFQNTSTALIPFDNTIPQIGEGIQVSNLNITATSVCNFVDIEYELNLTHSVPSEIIVALFMDGAANAIAATWTYSPTADKPVRARMRHRLRAPNTLGTTFQIRCGASQAGTTTRNGAAGAAILGGVLTEFGRVSEIVG